MILEIIIGVVAAVAIGAAFVALRLAKENAALLKELTPEHIQLRQVAKTAHDQAKYNNERLKSLETGVPRVAYGKGEREGDVFLTHQNSVILQVQINEKAN